MKNYKQIYEHLGDELSKEIFGYRVMYAETEGKLWIEKLVQTVSGYSRNLDVDDIPKVMFGAGEWGRGLVDVGEGNLYKWECFVDNNRHGTQCKGIPVISFDEYLNKYKNANVFVASGLWHKEMVKQLKEAGIAEKQIIDLAELLQKQYFDLPELFHSEEEVFVDCGCDDGGTSNNFAEWSGNKYKHIYAFEAEEGKLERCKAVLPQEKTTIYPLGVWKERGELHFEGTMNGRSHIAEEGELVIPVDSLDNVLKDEKVTFIKMDIEGSELNALRGAKEIIQKNHPKLALSIYHRPEDIYEMPELLLGYNSDYTFYLRHYSYSASETVLYAIDKNI